jgi:Redoxin.
MKKKLMIICVIALAVFTVFGTYGYYCTANAAVIPNASASTANPFAKMKTKDINGSKVTYNSFAGHKITMINVWATWCGYCVSEMPELQKISKEYSNSRKVRVMGVITQTDNSTGAIRSGLTSSERTKAKKIIRQAGTTYHQLLVSSSMASVLSGLEAFPTTYFVNSKGKIIGSPVLGARSKAQWESIIKAKLKAAS